MAAAGRHVQRIDPHAPFTDPAIGGHFGLAESEQMVFEFTFRDLPFWREKIATRKRALEDVSW